MTLYVSNDNVPVRLAVDAGTVRLAYESANDVIRNQALPDAYVAAEIRRRLEEAVQPKVVDQEYRSVPAVFTVEPTATVEQGITLHRDHVRVSQAP